MGDDFWRNGSAAVAAVATLAKLKHETSFIMIFTSTTYYYNKCVMLQRSPVFSLSSHSHLIGIGFVFQIFYLGALWRINADSTDDNRGKNDDRGAKGC
jgi:hypothetical protein